jgi:solute carrier family 25 protein 39/40
LCTTPFDVAKTRQQVADRSAERAGRHGAGGVGRGNVSTIRLVRDIARTEGVGALFAGVVPRVVKVAPSCAVMIASYEFGKSFFRRRRRAAEDGA